MTKEPEIWGLKLNQLWPPCQGGKEDEVSNGGYLASVYADLKAENARLREELARIKQERDNANDALTVAYMQGAASVRERAGSAEDREVSRLTDEVAKKDAALRVAEGALKIGREHCLMTNRSEGMLDGFGPRKPRQSDTDLSAIDDALATIRALLNKEGT